MTTAATTNHFVNPKYTPVVYTACAATALAGAAVCFPWEVSRIVGATTLTGIFYATINDMFACRECIEYFTIGHVWDGQELGRRPIMTLNPNLNAIAWGMIASWHVSAIAGLLFAAVARAPYAALKLTTRQIVPILAASASILFVIAHVVSKIQKFALEKAMEDDLTLLPYRVPREYQVGWHANNMRNSVGYLGLAALGILFMIYMLLARLRFLPNFLNVAG